MTNTVKDIELCATAWLRAGQELGIRVVAPFEITDGSIHCTFAAYLPDFGSSSGCYLYPMTSSEQGEWRSIHAWAKAHRRYVSFIHPDAYRTYDRERFVESLSDWGYFGDVSLQPSWFRKSMGSPISRPVSSEENQWGQTRLIPRPSKGGIVMADIFIEVMVWKHLDSANAVRYCCLNDLAVGKYAVHSADFFRMPLNESQFRYFERQFVELFTETSPRERCLWFDSLEEAIKAHDQDFSS